MRKSTLSERLNKRVTLQQEMETPDGAGGYALSWQDVATVWAEIIPLRVNRGDERLIASQQEDRAFFRITIRYRDNVIPKMRLRFGLRTLNIVGVVNEGEGNESLEIYAIEGTAQ